MFNAAGVRGSLLSGKLSLGNNSDFSVFWILRTFLSVPTLLSINVHPVFPMTDLGFFSQFSA